MFRPCKMNMEQKFSEGNIGLLELNTTPQSKEDEIEDLFMDEEEPDEEDGKQKVRAMAFTDYSELEPRLKMEQKSKYLCYGPELTKKGQHHWQGYVYWISPRSIRACAKAYGCTFKVARGSAERNRVYCGAGLYICPKKIKIKQPNPEFKEFGKIPQQGERNDLIQLRDQIIDGKRVDEIMTENPVAYHKFGRTLNALEDVILRKKYRTAMTTCDWYWGPTGVGKSHTCFHGYDPDKCYILPNDRGWWDGYKGQEIVIINEYRGWIPYDELLQLIDKWPYNVRRRNREPTPFTSKHVIITCSMPPEDIYVHRNENDNINQLLRRIKVIRCEREVPE